MHRYRSAAKRQAWYDDPDGPISWNPFGKIRESSPLVMIRERRQTDHILEDEDEEFSGDRIHRRAKSLPVDAFSPANPALGSEAEDQDLGLVSGGDEKSHKSGFSAPWYAILGDWYFLLRNVSQQQWRRLRGQLKPSSPINIESGLVKVSSALLPPSGDVWNHLCRKERPRRALIIDYGQQGGIAITTPSTSREFKEFLRNYPINRDNSSMRLENEVLRSLSETTAATPALNLRVIYVQDDCRYFRNVVEKYGVEFPRHRSNFCEWAAAEIGEAAQSVQTEQTGFWRRTPDKARGIVRTAFGMEYLILENPWTAAASAIDERGISSKALQKAYFEKSKAVPKCSFQRLSICVQLRRPRNAEVKPDTTDESSLFKRNTVIVFDTAKAEAAREALVPNDKTWQDLSAYMELDEQNTDESKTDKAYVTPLTEIQGQDDELVVAALRIVFEAIGWKWNEYITDMGKYVAFLEEIIYGAPAEDKHSSSLWEVSKQLLQAERLLVFHILLLENVETEIAGMLGLDPKNRDWLKQTLNDLRTLRSEVEETLKKPVAHMVDLMYKSISIRDARQSFELNTSLWRLSWITFIFLPLTFLSGFFGMNVDLFENNPPLKWYFIVAAPFMCLIMISWLLTRTLTRRQRMN